jgi:hypothetical protein
MPLPKLFPFLFLLLSTTILSSQPNDSTKAEVYIVRTDIGGSLINFKFFVGDQFVVKFNHGKYLRLELDPGEHVIWATSENRSFVRADLKAGETYVLNALPVTGALKAGVMLFPLQDPEKGVMRRAKRYVAKFKEKVMSKEDLAKDQEKFAEIIRLRLEKYEKVKNKPRVKILDTSVDWANIPLKKERN